MIEQNDARLVYMPESEIMAATGMCEVIRNYWWAVHPDRGLIFYKSRTKDPVASASPQGNRDERVARQLMASLYPWAEARQFPMVIRPIRIQDYV